MEGPSVPRRESDVCSAGLHRGKWTGPRYDGQEIRKIDFQIDHPKRYRLLISKRTELQRRRHNHAVRVGINGFIL